MIVTFLDSPLRDGHRESAVDTNDHVQVCDSPLRDSHTESAVDTNDHVQVCIFGC